MRLDFPDLDVATQEQRDDGNYAFDSVQVRFEAKPDSVLTMTNQYNAGEWWDGVIASEVVQYSFVGTKAYESNEEMTIGTTAKAALALLADPEQQLQQVQYSTPDGWQQSLAWGVRTGPLVTDAELAKLECRKSDGGTGDYETCLLYTSPSPRD